MSEHQHKTFGLAFFKAADEEVGTFEALVSVFGNVDHGGDRVMPGAFRKSLLRWEESGDPIPVIWNHSWENPLAHIGKVNPGDAEETADGLVVKGQLDLDNEFAAQVYRLLKERRVKELSFGYAVKDAEQKDGALNLLELDLFEVGPTLKGMNPSTQLLAVKSFAREEQKAAHTLAEPLTGADAAAVKRSAEVLTAQLDADTKAGARLSEETRAAITQSVDLLSSLIATPVDETPMTSEAKALGTASDQDMDLLLRLNLLKEN